MAGGSYFEVEARVVAPGVVAKIAALIEPAAEKIERRLEEALRRGLSGGGSPGTQGARAGEAYAGAFARTLKTRIEAAIRSLPDVKLGADASKVDKKLAEVRAKLTRLLTDDSYRVELGITDKEVNAQLAKLRAELRALSNGADIRVRLDARTALAELEALKRATQDDNRRGNFISRMFDDLRARSGLIDKVTTKLGGLSDVASKAQPFLLPYAIVTALSLIGPLAGAGSAALLGMVGVAGVAAAAFFGLKQQVDDNVGFGARLKSQFAEVRDEAASLAQVAANAVGPGVVSAVQQVKEALPGFRGLVDLVGAKLGNAASAGVGALLTALQRAQPLILDFAGYIEKGANALQKFAQSKQFGDFLTYARQELPQVGSAIGSLVKGVTSLAVSMKSLGDNTVATLKGFGDLLAVVGKLGSAKIPGTDGSTADKLGLTSAGGILGNLANPLGAGLKYANYAQDNQDAEVAKKLAEGKAELPALQQAFAAASNGTAATLGATNGAYAAATSAAAAQASQLVQTTLQMRIQGDAAGLLKQRLDDLSGKNLGTAQTLTTLQSQLLGLKGTFDVAAFSATDLTNSAVSQRSALEQAVAAAQAHAEAIGKQTGSTAAATAALQADYDQILANTGATGNNRQAILDYINTIGAIPDVALTQIEAQTAQAEAAAARVAASLAGIPREVRIQFTGYAAQAQNVASQIANIRSAQGNILGPVGRYAQGGILDKLRASVPSFAQGVENHIPQIAMPNGGFRIWAEPETGGEAYIPLANDARRPRALAIWAQTGQRLGALAASRTAGSGDVSALAAELGALRSDVRDVQAAVHQNTAVYAQVSQQSARERTMAAQNTRSGA